MVLRHSMNAGSVVGILCGGVQKNLFELFSLTGNRNAKTLGTSACAIFHAIVFRGGGDVIMQLQRWTQSEVVWTLKSLNLCFQR